MHKSKHTSTMHQTSIYIQHTIQNMSNTPNMHIIFSLTHMNPNCYYYSPQPFLLLPKLPCPNLTPDCALADSLVILMPGPRLELKIMQTWADVGGCDAWMGSYWKPNQQWWVGWHSPQNLPNWAWPSDDWVLIGYERWYQPRRGIPSSWRPSMRLLTHRPMCTHARRLMATGTCAGATLGS